MMKKMMITAMVCLAACGSAIAESVQVTLTTGAAATYSDAIPASGHLDAIEIVTPSGCDTVTGTLATYDGTTALRTFYSKSLGTGTLVFAASPRVIGTTTAGVDLAAVAGPAAGTNTPSTVLVASYEKFMIGGNLKFSLGSCATTNKQVKATIYYSPVRR